MERLKFKNIVEWFFSLFVSKKKILDLKNDALLKMQKAEIDYLKSKVKHQKKYSGRKGFQKA